MSSKRIGKHFDRLGGRYDSEVSWRQDATLLAPFESLQGSLREPVLELGCGTGIVTSTAAPTKLAFGVDLSHGLLQIASRRGVRAILADAAKLPFPDDSIGSILVRQVFQYVAPAEVANELRRVARPDSRVFAHHFVIARPDDPEWWRAVKLHTQPHRRFVFRAEDIDRGLRTGGWERTAMEEQLHRRNLRLSDGYFTPSSRFRDPHAFLEWVQATAPIHAPESDIDCRVAALEFDYTQTWVFSEYRRKGRVR